MFRATLKAALFFIAGLGLTAGALPGPVFGQVDLRSTFPGRRVGGGTRGECSARTLAHLVPINSVYSPGTSGDLGLVQGPTANPVSLTMTFIPNSGGGVESVRILDAASVGLILVSGAGLIGQLSGSRTLTAMPMIKQPVQTLFRLLRRCLPQRSVCYSHNQSPAMFRFKTR
jgi:hypothetical protein